MYLCRNCQAEMRDLLIGSPHVKGQPGLVWYLERIKEQAYRQARVATASTKVSSTVAGYDLLSDRRAIDLLNRIKDRLDYWVNRAYALSPQGLRTGLSATLADKQALAGMRGPVIGFSSREAKQARFLSARLGVLARRCDEVHRLRAELLGFAAEAREAINPPADNFCGPCPAVFSDGQICNSMLYATEDATTVECQWCHATHDVAQLRSAMREVVRDVLFTGSEIRRLMETRLADKMSKSLFYKMIHDGRLIPKGYNGDNEPLFTYADICEARRKPVPGPVRKKVKS